MISFLDYIDNYDIDLFIKEKGLVYSHKTLILSFRFVRFFFKGVLEFEEKNKTFRNNIYKNKFIQILKDNNILFEELSFDDIYKIKHDFDLNKILFDCENKKNNIVNKMRWIKIRKEDLKSILLNPVYQKKYKSIKEMDKLQVEDALYYYNMYIDSGKNEKKNHICII
ncbi:hypothetical protein Yalta_011 [Yalta virus]|nr:hypothetical protein Yalta_011 [Yalta virus]